MFTGLVEEVGTVRTVRKQKTYQLLEVRARTVLDGSVAGDSISIDGACQTVTYMTESFFRVETLSATLAKTTLGAAKAGRRVNLERAMTLSDRLGGHLVQGHVDGTGTVGAVRREAENLFVTIRVPRRLLPYCVSEGSVAVDGVSLTIAGLAGDELSVNIIPLTWNNTVLSERKPGDPVNIETDIIGRYVERLLGARLSGSAAAALDSERLKSLGYT